jgi:hypothetical protein
LAQASGTNVEEIAVEPKQEVFRSINLSASYDVYGNFSAQNGDIDFFVADPSGRILLGCNSTTGSPFFFSASKDGNYTVHFVNSASTSETHVKLVYVVKYWHHITGSMSMLPISICFPLGYALLSIIATIVDILGLIPQLPILQGEQLRYREPMAPILTNIRNAFFGSMRARTDESNEKRHQTT